MRSPAIRHPSWRNSFTILLVTALLGLILAGCSPVGFIVGGAIALGTSGGGVAPRVLAPPTRPPA